MSRPDSSAIANALIAKLGADTELLAHVPDNVHEDMGPEGAKRFVVVSQILATDQSVMNQGRVVHEGLASELRNNAALRQQLLGV